LTSIGRPDEPGSSSDLFCRPWEGGAVLLENEGRAAAAVPPDWDDKLRGIQSITDRALSGLDPQAMLDALVERVREALQADTAAVLLLDRQDN